MKNSEKLLQGKKLAYKAGNYYWFYKFEEGKVKVKKGNEWATSRNTLEEMNKYKLTESKEVK